MTTMPLGRIVRSLTAAAMLFAVLPAAAQADLSGGNNFYRVSADQFGWFDQMTGTYHSARSAEKLVYGGFGFVHSYTSGTDYELVYETATLSAIPGGVRQEIRPAGPDSLVIQQDTTVSGTTEASSLVRTTLRLQNTGTQTVNLGARIALDVVVTDDDGPRFAADGSSPLVAQSRIVSPSFRTFTLENDHGQSTEERTRWTAAATGVNTTAPDVLDVAACCYGSHSPLLPPLTEGGNAAALSTDSEVRWVWGPDAAHGRTILPGKTISFSVGGVLTRGDFVTANTARPAVSGIAKAGATLNATRGTWKQTALTAYDYRWLRCDAAGAGCTTIAGATGAAYGVQDGDIGHRLKARVTADGDVFADSLATAAVVAADAVPPTVEEPVSAFSGVIGAGASVTATPVRTSWSGVDAGTGICSYALAVSRDGGAFTNVALSSPTATSVVQNLDAGGHYVYRITATDCAGNATTALAGSVAPGLRDAAAAGSGLAFAGTWNTQSYKYAFGGTLRYTTAAGAKISYTAATRGLAIAARPAPDRGAVRISVDGGPGETVDLGAGPTDTRVIVYQRAFPTLATHTITVENLATPGRPRVEVDAFASLGS